MREYNRTDVLNYAKEWVTFGHTLVITETKVVNNMEQILVATHTEDSYNRNLLTYRYKKLRGIKIEGVRT